MAENCVPVALNLYEIRKAAGTGGDFFRAVQKQRPAQYQGLYLVTAAGKVLASHQAFKDYKTWPQEVLADLRPGLAAFGRVTARRVQAADPLPGRGIGSRPEGGICLAVFLRPAIKGIPLRELPNPTIDSLVLRAEDLKVLVPAELRAGAAREVPATVGRKFSRILGPGDENTMPRPHEVQAVRFVAKVRSVDKGRANLTYEGEIKGAHETQSNRGKCHGRAKLTGIGTYDVKAGRLQSLIWVFDGIYVAPPPYNQPVRYSGVVEWRSSLGGQ